MTNEHMLDAHLKKALEHAPDANVQVSTHVRNIVLDYAKKSTNPKTNWLASVKNWLLKDHFANAQWAGLAGLAAVFLVTVLMWRGHPEDTVWIAATPDVISENSPASAEVPAQVTGAVSQDVAPAEEILPADSTAITQTAPTVAKNKQTRHATPEAKKLDRLANKDGQLKEVAESEQTSRDSALDLAKSIDTQLGNSRAEGKTAEKNVAEQVAIAEAPIVSAPAAAATEPMIATEQNMPSTEATDKLITKPMSKPKTISRGLADSKAEAGTTSTQESVVAASDADINSTTLHAEKRRQKLKGNLAIDTDFAKTILLNGGQAMAKSDTETGNYRLFKVITHSESDAKIADCVAPKTLVDNIDERSGLPIINIDVCTASMQLLKEVENYNKAMIDWYLQYQSE